MSSMDKAKEAVKVPVKGKIDLYSRNYFIACALGGMCFYSMGLEKGLVLSRAS